RTEAGDQLVAVGGLELIVVSLGGDPDQLAGVVDDLVGVDPQAAVALGGILHQPVNDVAPELAEVAVVPLAPVAFEVLAPTDRGVGEHGKRAAAAERLTGKNGHKAGAGERAIGG